MNCYLMTWLGYNVERQAILDALDTIPQIVNWRATVGGIFLASEMSANELGELINPKLPAHVHFVLVPARIYEIGGYTDQETWDFIRRPRPAGQP